MKRLIVGALAIGSITAISIDTYNTYQDNQLINRIMQSEYNPYRMIQVKRDELKRQQDFEKSIQDKKLEIADYIGSSEYKLREETRHWRLPLGITVDQLQPTTFKATAYSELPEENGGWDITCNGEKLSEIRDIVANNTLPQGSKIYMNGQIYRVADRGSSRFNNISRLDVLVNRLPGESDNAYRKRISDYGVKHFNGYIIKE